MPVMAQPPAPQTGQPRSGFIGTWSGTLVLLVPILLSACAAPAGLAIFGASAGVAMGTSVDYTLNGIAYKTFVAPMPAVRQATLTSLNRMGMKVVEIATSPRDGIDLDSLKNALNAMDVAACVVMPNFQNPLGALMPNEKKRELVTMLAKSNIPLIEDDVYAELYFGKTKPPPAKFYDQSGLVLHCGSFAKSLAPGARIGWVTPGRFKSEVERLKFVTTISTSSLPQAALAEYLKHGGYDRHLRGFRQRLSTALADMTHEVTAHFPAGCRLTQPQGGYMLWVEMPQSIDALALHRRALEQGISIGPGPLFSARRKYQNFVRLNYGHFDAKSTGDALRTLGCLSADLMR